MAETKTCPKCSGTMRQGRILKLNEFVTGNQYMYVFAPDDDPDPDVSKGVAGKPGLKGRKPLAAFCCESCGYTELYGLTT